jgi:hypothetical protein
MNQFQKYEQEAVEPTGTPRPGHTVRVGTASWDQSKLSVKFTSPDRNSRITRSAHPYTAGRSIRTRCPSASIGGRAAAPGSLSAPDEG